MAERPEKNEKTEKKGVLDWISDALYERVETGPDEAAPRGVRGEARPSAIRSAPPAPAAPQVSPTDLAARLREQIEERGPAFTQFLSLVASFADIIPDEAGRYRAALTALEKTGGVTPEQVLLAGKDQLQALESQREVFAEAVSRKRQELRESVGGVDAIRAEIAGLEQRIGALREREQAILREVAAGEARVKTAEEGFSSMLGRLQDEITGARGKIRKYLA